MKFEFMLDVFHRKKNLKSESCFAGLGTEVFVIHIFISYSSSISSVLSSAISMQLVLRFILKKILLIFVKLLIFVSAIDVILRYAAAKKHRISGTTIFPVPATNERTNYLGEVRSYFQLII